MDLELQRVLATFVGLTVSALFVALANKGDSVRVGDTGRRGQ